MLKKLSALVLMAVLATLVVVELDHWEAAAQSGNSGTTHAVLTNDQYFQVSNNKYLSGIYECSDGGYIDSSCVIGHFPEVSCPAGYAIQVISPSITPATCIAVGTTPPAGADTYVQYNLAGVFGADSHFTWNYTSSILTLGGAGPGEATFAGDLLANLGTPSDGTIAYCSNCTINTSPCSTGGTGSMASRINSQWVCFGASSGGTVTGSGTTNHLAKWTSSTVLGDSAATDDGTTLTVASRNFSYSQALYITGLVSMSSSVGMGATDRIVLCTSGSSTDKTYTLSNATGSGRVIDVGKIDSGTNACKITVGAGNINSGTTVSLPSQWNWETCIDTASSQWSCRGVGAVS